MLAEPHFYGVTNRSISVTPEGGVRLGNNPKQLDPLSAIELGQMLIEAGRKLLAQSCNPILRSTERTPAQKASA